MHEAPAKELCTQVPKSKMGWWDLCPAQSLKTELASADNSLNEQMNLTLLHPWEPQFYLLGVQTSLRHAGNACSLGEETCEGLDMLELFLPSQTWIVKYWPIGVKQNVKKSADPQTEMASQLVSKGLRQLLKASDKVLPPEWILIRSYPWT